MATRLDFIPSDGNYRFNATLDAERLGVGNYTFDVRWNSSDNNREGAWYFDMYSPDGIIMAAGVKIVINIPLARKSAHPFFTHNVIVAIDSTRSGLNPGFDELGTRVQLYHLTEGEFAALLLV